MTLDWIPNTLKTGDAEVYCKTCETICEYDGVGLYECECDFGATLGALAYGLPGYEWRRVDE